MQDSLSKMPAVNSIRTAPWSVPPWLTSAAGRIKPPLSWLHEHFPLSLQGTVVLLLALLALRVFGYGSMDLVVFALAVCAIAIVVFCLLAVVLGGLLVQRKLKTLAGTLQQGQGKNRPDMQTVEAGYPNETGFSVPTMPWLPLISLSWRIIYPDAVRCRISLSSDEQRWEEEVIPELRCKSNRITRLFSVRDVLGLCRFSWRMVQDREFTALPQSSHIKSLPLLRSLTAEDGIPDPGGKPEGDRMEIRPYAQGDSVRNIMWQAYARNRELNVRLPEKSVFHSSRTLAYLVSGAHDEAAAATARVAIESGALGDDWLFAADGGSAPTSNVDAALSAIAQSRVLDGERVYGLDDFLQQQTGSDHCVVFASAASGPWLEALRRTLASRGGGSRNARFSVVLATDGVTDPAELNRWQLLGQSLVYQTAARDRQADAAHQTTRTDLSRSLAELSHLAASTLIVDRHTGLSFDHRMNKV